MLVTPESALAMDAAHETTFQDAKLTHDELLNDIEESRDAIVTYQHRGQPTSSSGARRRTSRCAWG